MNAKEAFQKHQELLDEIESRTLMDIYPTEIQSLRGYALVGNLELDAIKKRAEEIKKDILEYSQQEGCYEEEKLLINVPNIIDFIIKGEPK